MCMQIILSYDYEMRIYREEDVKTSIFYMYFGGLEDKCREKPQMFGRTEGDNITIMPLVN